MNLKVILPIIVLGVVVVAALAIMPGNFTPHASIVTDFSDSDSVSPTSTPIIMETNGQKHMIPLDKIKGGGPPKDGIPSIDDPKFVEVQGSAFVSDSDVVIGLEINGDTRAYPLFILVWHEIVNDRVGDIPVAVTYCPLCYTLIRSLSESLMEMKLNLELLENYTTAIC